MLILLSPAKSLTLDRAAGQGQTTPRFLSKAKHLTTILTTKTPEDFSRMMDLSPALATLTYDRVHTWTPEGGYGAASLFDGDAYQTLAWDTLPPDTAAYGQDHLRILSGLYGILRPLDSIAPYRLEMGRTLAPGDPVVGHWKPQTALALAQDAQTVGATHILNLASQEYFESVDTTQLDIPVISPRFLEDRKGTLKVISFSAKRARGAMARWALINRLDTPDALPTFSWNGYVYAPSFSTAQTPTYVKAR